MNNDRFFYVKEFAEKIHQELLMRCRQNPNSNLSLVYKGSQIYYSQRILKPKVLIVGINPGAGYFTSKNTRVENFEPLDMCEYMDTENTGNYSLAKQVRWCFDKAGKLDVLEKSAVKTNVFFQATTNSNSLRTLRRIARDERIDMEDNVEIVHSLINDIDPELLLIEGVAALWALESLKPEFKKLSNMLYSSKNDIATIELGERQVMIFRRFPWGPRNKEALALELGRVLR